MSRVARFLDIQHGSDQCLGVNRRDRAAQGWHDFPVSGAI